ncbi:helix-turn-helix transcriptional regulator [Microcoleus sp. FACHB-53]|nr:helix-turn-helix transcriptional regulator [Microcoleus sp. FACHB-53]
MASVGEKLKQRRNLLNLTQQQVADELGVTVTTVKNWEAGRYIPKLYLPQTKALCDLLNFTLEDLAD